MFADIKWCIPNDHFCYCGIICKFEMQEMYWVAWSCPFAQWSLQWKIISKSNQIKSNQFISWRYLKLADATVIKVARALTK